MSKPTRDGIGARIAAVRKAAGLSQREVADSLGVPPRTFSYYESADGDLPSSLLVPLADVLGVDVHELLGPPKGRSAPNEAGRPASPGASRRAGISATGRRKPGPKGYLQERFEAVREMPRKDQQFVVKFLDQVIEDYGRRRRSGVRGCG